MYGISKTILDELGEVFERIDNKQMESLEKYIISARRIILVGVGREGLSTKAFTMRLMHLGLKSHWIWDDTTPALEKGDLLIATSGCGGIGHIHYVVERAIETGAEVFLITGDPNNKTSSMLKNILFVPASVYLGTADVVHSIQPMGNLFEQSLFILFDIIIIELMKKLNMSKGKMESNHRNLE